MAISEDGKKYTAKKAMREALKGSGMKQTELAEELGITQASVSSNMNRSKVGIDVFLEMTGAMGYTTCLGKKENGKFVPIWELEKEEE